MIRDSFGGAGDRFRDRPHVSSDNTLTWLWCCKTNLVVGVAKKIAASA